MAGDKEQGPFLVENVAVMTDAMMSRHFNRGASEGYALVEVTAPSKDRLVVVWRR